LIVVLCCDILQGQEPSSKCTHCFSVRVGGGFVLYGAGDANNNCMLCGAHLNGDLYDLERFLQEKRRQLKSSFAAGDARNKNGRGEDGSSVDGDDSALGRRAGLDGDGMDGWDPSRETRSAYLRRMGLLPSGSERPLYSARQRQLLGDDDSTNGGRRGSVFGGSRTASALARLAQEEALRNARNGLDGRDDADRDGNGRGRGRNGSGDDGDGDGDLSINTEMYGDGSGLDGQDTDDQDASRGSMLGDGLGTNGKNSKGGGGNQRRGLRPVPGSSKDQPDFAGMRKKVDPFMFDEDEIASNPLLSWLLQFCILTEEKKAKFKKVFNFFDSDHDFLITPAQVCHAWHRMCSSSVLALKRAQCGQQGSHY
jgi:hypothetical protein